MSWAHPHFGKPQSEDGTESIGILHILCGMVANIYLRNHLDIPSEMLRNTPQMELILDLVCSKEPPKNATKSRFGFLLDFSGKIRHHLQQIQVMCITM